MVPSLTTQLGKMRLYNTTRGTNALISNCNTTTNTLTLTANVPAGWTIGDTITIASQTVSGGGLNWVDIEITSGPTGRSYLFMSFFIRANPLGTESAVIHPLETYAASKTDRVDAQVSNILMEKLCLLSITNNVFSLSWAGLLL